MKGTAKIAYWDSEQRDQMPNALGGIKGTPTIRLFKPKHRQKSSGSYKDKAMVEYQLERKAKDMKRFLEEHMPNYAQAVSNGAIDLEKFEAKANKHGLPQVLLFSSKPNTSARFKFYSTEFRRRLLLAEIKPTKKNKEIIDRYKITDLPAMIVILHRDEDDGDETSIIARFHGANAKDFTHHRVMSFLSDHALEKPVSQQKKKKTEVKEEL